MSIYAYVGLPGSGKSYGVVANQIVPSLRQGRHVVTNLPVKAELLRELIPGCEVTTFQTSEVAEDPESIRDIFPAGCVAVIDEVWRLWPAGLKVDRIPEAFKSFLAEHRHCVDKKGRSTQIVLVTQDLAQIAAFARQLVEQTFVHRKLRSLGMDKRYTVTVFEGNVTGLTPPESKKIAQNIGTYKNDITRLYTSHTMSESAEAGADEKPIDSRGNVWSRPVLWIGMVCALAGLGFGGTWVYGAVREPSSALGGNVVDRPQSAASQSVPRRSPPGLPRAEPAVWRVTGYLRESDTATGGYAFVSDGRATDVVPLTACVIARFRVECDYNGARLSLKGQERGIEEPQPRPIDPL